MISGIGLDIVELNRIESIMKRTDKFQRRILSDRELSVFEGLSDNRKLEFLAARFAAKEAYAKANGTGIRPGCSFHQIEILNNDFGKPLLYFNGQLVNGFISITHTKIVAAAQVILQTDV